MLKSVAHADAMLEIATDGFTHQPEQVQRCLCEDGYIEPMVSGRQRWTVTPKGLVVMRAHGYRSVPNYCRNPGLSRARPNNEFKHSGTTGNAHADDRIPD